MDFVGQKLAEDVLRVMMISFAIIGVVTGFYYQSLTVLYLILGAGLLLTALAMVPPWPLYRKNPVAWHQRATGPK